MRPAGVVRRLSRAVAALREGPDRGVSLMELTVAVFVFGFVVIGVATLTAGIERTDHETFRRVDATDEARYAVRMIARTLSSAVVPGALGGGTGPAVSVAGATSLTVHANIDNPGNAVGVSRVVYELADGVLTQTVSQPRVGTRDQFCSLEEAATPACEGRVSTLVLARDVANTASDPLFRYQDGNDALTTVTAAIRSVRVSVAVRHDTERPQPPVRMVERVYMFQVR